MHDNDLSNCYTNLLNGQSQQKQLTFNDGIRGQLLNKTPLLVCIQIEMEGIN
jgi:hypothetical protein